MKLSSSVDKIGIRALCWALGILLAIALFIEAQSPLYIFINDTPNRVAGHIIGGTSPGVDVDLYPGGIKVIDMAWWWGEPYRIANYDIDSTINFLVVKIVRISHQSKMPKYPPLDSQVDL